MSNPLLIWDKPGIPKGFLGRVILLDSLREEKSFISLPAYLEKNAERLRSKYLEFISELGARKFEGQSISQHLDIGDGLSYWWMTTLAEKSPFKSPNIYKSLLMLALEEILVEYRPSEVFVDSNQSEYQEIVQGICGRLSIPCSCEFQGFVTSRMRLFQLRSFLLGLTSVLKRFTMRYKARFSKKNEWSRGNKNVSIFSYFTHLSSSHCADGVHYSFMWTALPELLTNNGWSINWFQHYLPNDGKVSLAEGLKLLDSFSTVEGDSQTHRFLDSHLSISVFLTTLKSWFKLRKKLRRLQNIPALFQIKNSGVNLWPLLKREWVSSTSGQTAAINCLWVALFDATLKKISHQTLGLYIHENQAWEHALLASWRKYKHGKIVSVQHATAPFWHLYYFNHESIYLNKNSDGMPVPDLWSVNGPAVYEAFVSSGYPADKLIMLEALRYLDADGQQRKHQAKTEGAKVPSATLKVLALGDLMPDFMDSLILALKNCIDVLPHNYKFSFKPHPADNTNACERLGLDIDHTIEPLSQILKDFDVVVGSHATSATLDSYLAGVKPIVFLNGKTFNLSPLRGYAGAEFVSSSRQLVDLLTSHDYLGASLNDDEEFFLSDPGLVRWERLLLASDIA